jgi:hypothetical protein
VITVIKGERLDLLPFWKNELNIFPFGATEGKSWKTTCYPEQGEYFGERSRKKEGSKTRELKPIKKKTPDEHAMMKPYQCEVDAKNDTDFLFFWNGY